MWVNEAGILLILKASTHKLGYPVHLGHVCETPEVRDRLLEEYRE